MQDPIFSKNNIYFLHQRMSLPIKGTVAIQLPDWGVIGKNIFDFEPYFEAKIGTTVLHPKDKYSKKIGRNMAISNMKFTTLQIENIQILNGGLNLEITASCKIGLPPLKRKTIRESRLTLRFLVTKNKEKINFIIAHWDYDYDWRNNGRDSSSV